MGLYIPVSDKRLQLESVKTGVQALVAMGNKGDVIKYAKASCGLNDSQIAIDQACEGILLSSGLYEEAYQLYALMVNRGRTNLATFRSITKKYSMKDQHEILEDLIESTPGEEGKWFATAKSLGLLPLALKLAHQSPCEPKTLNRAARDYLDKNPKFALGVAIASLHWLVEGWGYEITGSDVYAAYDYALKAAENLGITDQVKADIAKIVSADKSPGMLVRDMLSRHLDLRQIKWSIFLLLRTSPCCLASIINFNVGLGLVDYSALKNSIFRVINSSSKTEVCFSTIGPAD